MNFVTLARFLQVVRFYSVFQTPGWGQKVSPEEVTRTKRGRGPSVWEGPVPVPFGQH